MLRQSLGELTGRAQKTQEAKTTPRGWESGVEMGAEGGEVTTGPVDAPVGDWSEVLKLWNLDPALFEVLEPVTFKAWDMGIKNNDGEIVTKRMYSYKARIRRRAAGVDPDELTALRQAISLLPALPVKTSVIGDQTFIVCLADWQMGKGERGGSAVTIERVQTALAAARTRLDELIAAGRKIDQVALIGLGDLVEGCIGFYAMQQFQVDLTRREQVNVVRRLLLRALRTFADTGLSVVVATAAGNHGENRNKGKAFTTFGDNDDIAVFEQVADIVDQDPAVFGYPQFVIPGDDLSVTLTLSGVRVAAVHGHQFGNGSSASAKAITWWMKQALGDQPVGGAQILLSGHLHHFTSAPHGERTHFQAPSLDGGSQWYREVAGVDSPSGLLTLVVGTGCGPLGWADVQLITTGE